MNAAELQPYAFVRAVFRPRRIDDLKPGALPFIGQTGVFECMWEIDDVDAYMGEWAMMFPRDWNVEGACWAPSSDLEIIEPVTRQR